MNKEPSITQLQNGPAQWDLSSAVQPKKLVGTYSDTFCGPVTHGVWLAALWPNLKVYGISPRSPQSVLKKAFL